MTNMKFRNKVVVITGAGSGIGRACALEFAREGADLVVADINGEGARETIELMSAHKVKAKAFEVDVSNPESVERLAKEAIKNFGSIYTLVNNAAIQVNKKIEETSFEEWNRQVAVNLGGVFLCSRQFLPHLRISRGSIVNMSSVNGFFVEPTCAGYCATKAAIIGLTKAMAIDHGNEGIRVNCICPGTINTPLLDKAVDAFVGLTSLDKQVVYNDLNKIQQGLMNEHTKYMPIKHLVYNLLS